MMKVMILDIFVGSLSTGYWEACVRFTEGDNECDAAGCVVRIDYNASFTANKLAFQKYFTIPVCAASFEDVCRIGVEGYHTLKGLSGTDLEGMLTH